MSRKWEQIAVRLVKGPEHNFSARGTSAVAADSAVKPQKKFVPALKT